MTKPRIVKSGALQFAGSFRDALPSDAEPICNKLLRHNEFIALQPIDANQESLTKLLVHRVMAIAKNCLRYLRYPSPRLLP